MNKQFADLIGSNQIKSSYKKQFDEAKKLVNKWTKTGLLDEIADDYTKNNMAILLENQARQLIYEISKTGTQAGSEEWSGVALPLVRRIFSEIAAKDFVSLQAMNLPSGLVFYLDFKYGTNQPGFQTAAGASNQANSVYGITNQTSDASEGLYGAGRFGYSINDYTVTPLSASYATASWADVDYNAALSSSVSASELMKATLTLGNVSFDTHGVRAFYISGSNCTYYPAYTKAVDATGAASTTQVTFVISASTYETTSAYTIKYHKQPEAYTRGDFEAPGDPAWASGSFGPEKYSPGASVGANALDMPEINVELRSEPIIAKTRKLKAVWTPEFAQDLNAYHSIDAEQELTSMLSEYISMEIDLEILDMLILNAPTTDVWSAKIGTVNTGVNTFSTQDQEEGRSLAYIQNTWFQTLGTKVQKLSNKIHAKTMRGGANFLTCSPDVATILESIPGYSVDTDGSKMQYAMGVQKVGMLNNRFTVYKNPYMQENTVLLGFRGTQFLETGAVYAPYIPLIMTPLIYDPTNLTPRKGVLTRYAKKMVRPEFYAKLFVSHLNYV